MRASAPMMTRSAPSVMGGTAPKVARLTTYMPPHRLAASSRSAQAGSLKRMRISADLGDRGGLAHGEQGAGAIHRVIHAQRLLLTGAQVAQGHALRLALVIANDGQQRNSLLRREAELRLEGARLVGI